MDYHRSKKQSVSCFAGTGELRSYVESYQFEQKFLLFLRHVLMLMNMQTRTMSLFDLTGTVILGQFIQFN